MIAPIRFHGPVQNAEGESVPMSLLKTIRSDRARQGRRQPHARRSINTVGCVIRKYHLDGTFLDRLDSSRDPSGDLRVDPVGVKAKRPLDVPPFALFSEADYRLAEAIVERCPNPYLAYAHSPEEILLATALFALSPMLTPRDLLRADFETLIRVALARRELALLEAAGELCPKAECGEGDGLCGEGSQPMDCQGRIQQLRAFIRDVETMEVPTE